MKKQFFLVAFSIAAAVTANAQRFVGDKVYERPRIGLHGGLSDYSQSYSGVAYGSSDSKAGFTAGLDFELPLKYGVYLQPEVNYSQMGGQDWVSYDNGSSSSSSSSNQYYGTLHYNYLQVPILIKYKPLHSGFGIYAGPQYGYLLNTSFNFHDGGPNDKTAKDVSYRNELSGLAGIEYYFPDHGDGPKFGLSARYQFGITNIVDKNKAGYDQASIRNNGFFLTAGVRF